MLMLQETTAVNERFVFDGDYLKRLRSGDPQTERHFVRYFRAPMRAKFSFRFRVSDGVDDLVQDAFLAVLDKVHHGEPRDPAKLAAYVLRVCDNISFQKIREKAKRKSTDLDVAGLPGNQATAEDRLISEDRKARVRKVLDTLSPRERTLLLRFAAEEDKDQLCREIGVDRTYLRVLLHRALKHLRQKMALSEA